MLQVVVLRVVLLCLCLFAIISLVHNSKLEPRLHAQEPQTLIGAMKIDLDWHQALQQFGLVQDLAQLNLTLAQVQAGIHLTEHHQMAHLHRAACRLASRQPLKVIFTGTSNTDGRLKPFFTGVFAAWLNETFPSASPHRVVVNGIGGGDACSITRRFGGFEKMRKWLITGTFDLVVVEFDVNARVDTLPCLEAVYRLLLEYNVSIIFLDVSTPYCAPRNNLPPQPEGCNITTERTFLKANPFSVLSDQMLSQRAFYRCFGVPFVSLYDLVLPLSSLPLWSQPQAGNCGCNRSVEAIVAGDCSVHVGARGNRLAAVLIETSLALAASHFSNKCTTIEPILVPDLHFAHPSEIFGLMEGIGFPMWFQTPVFQGSGWAQCYTPWPALCSPWGFIHKIHGRFPQWFNSSASRTGNNSLVLHVGFPISHAPRHGWSLAVKFQRSDFSYFGPFTVLVHHQNGSVYEKVVNGSWQHKMQQQSETLVEGISDTHQSNATVTFIPATNDTQVVLLSLEIFPSQTEDI